MIPMGPQGPGAPPPGGGMPLRPPMAGPGMQPPTGPMPGGPAPGGSPLPGGMLAGMLQQHQQQQQPQGGPPVGLCANPPGKAFQCGTCQFFQQSRCGNPDPRLNGKPVQPVWCCNLYKNPQMQTLIP